eukprot:UN03369
MNRLSPEICFEYFMCGYTRNYSSLEYFPTSLILIMIKYLQTIFMNFDVYHEQYESCIFDNGFTFKRNQEKGVFVIGCSKRNKGRHTFKIKLIDGVWGNDAIGITKHIYVCKQRSIHSIDMLNGYFWKGNKLSLTYGNNEFSVCAMSKRPSRNDVVSVHLDCKKWKLTFKLNGEPVHDTESISAGKYHLVICSAEQNSQYQLISKHVL